MPDIIYKRLNCHYSDVGTGKSIVFLHGFLEEKSMWKEVSKGFEKTHRVICVDLLGHGKTGNLGYVHSMEDQAHMLYFLLNHLGVKKSIFIGHSMGGYVGLCFAELYKDRVSGLCLMNSTARADDSEKRINRDRGIAVVKKNHQAFIRMAIPNLFSQENQSVYADTIEQITHDSLQMSQQGIIASLEGMKIRVDRSHLLEQSDFPVLMVIGKKDPALNLSLIHI